MMQLYCNNEHTRSALEAIVQDRSRYGLRYADGTKDPPGSRCHAYPENGDIRWTPRQQWGKPSHIYPTQGLPSGAPRPLYSYIFIYMYMVVSILFQGNTMICI